MLNAFASLKCSKNCQHNVQKPTQLDLDLVCLYSGKLATPKIEKVLLQAEV